VQVWNARNGQRLFTYEGHTSYVYSVAWSPDGSSIASSSADGTIQIWNAFLGQRSVTFLDRSTSITWSARGPFIAAGDSNGLVNLWIAE